MAFSLIYVLFAILGLGFLVFIHELGHYLVARRKGMRVEVFAIGFGKPIYSWEKEGVKWQICWLPFGGYVKIAGMHKEGSREPYEIADGFYGKRPWDRIQVAFAGPLVNIVFAFLAFTALWMSGGRDKSFAEFTHHIGWVDPQSALYEKGVRPGDVIQQYDGRPFTGFRDLLTASIKNGKTTEIAGYKIDALTGKRTDFQYTLPTYEDPNYAKEGLHTIGVFSPARYLIFDDAGKGASAFLPGSPMLQSGIQVNDRILWVDGEVIYSKQQLDRLINESSAFLTVQRNDQIFQTKVPRIRIDDLKLSGAEKGEIDDWQHEAGLKGRLQDLYFIPYNLSPDAKVESRLVFIDEDDQARAFGRCSRCSYFTPLEEGDQILAIDGTLIDSAYQFLEQLQTRHVLIIVQRDPAAVQKTTWIQADEEFDAFNRSDLSSLVTQIGTPDAIVAAGHLHLLKPVTPKPLLDFPLPEAQKEKLTQDLAQSRKAVEAIVDPQKRSQQLHLLEKDQNKAVLGLYLKDRLVSYNPSPWKQFKDVFEETWRTLYGLISGYLNPKYISGPVGIVQVVQQSWMLGAKEALFWMAVISLNLGLINLLPLPVLDGGHILFSFVEMVTKRPIRSSTMEKMIIPFIVLLILFFLYITYQDLLRIFSRFF